MILYSQTMIIPREEEAPGCIKNNNKSLDFNRHTRDALLGRYDVIYDCAEFNSVYCVNFYKQTRRALGETSPDGKIR